MNAKSTIKKIVFVAIWLCIGGGMFILLMAAITDKKKGNCSDIAINLNDTENSLFIDKKYVEELLFKATKGNIKGEPVSSFNLLELEQMLEHNSWVDKAELYFDNKDVLHVKVNEKKAVARIFTTEGNSFYIDSTGNRIPLSDKRSARVLVFTGFPDKKKISAKDSILLNDVKAVANQVNSDAFWQSQVAQIDITEDRNFEMIPVVGNHLVKLGNGENIKHKFNRLLVFYKQVLSKTGFDKYKVIDVQYKGQVVASRYAGNAKVDSIQLRKNVEKLLSQSLEAERDTVVRALPPTAKLDDDSITTPDPNLKDNLTSNAEKNSNPNPLKSNLPKTNMKKTEKLKKDKEPKPKPASKKPKAVMPAKVTVDENGGYN